LQIILELLTANWYRSARRSHHTVPYSLRRLRSEVKVGLSMANVKLRQATFIPVRSLPQTLLALRKM